MPTLPPGKREAPPVEGGDSEPPAGAASAGSPFARIGLWRSAEILALFLAVVVSVIALGQSCSASDESRQANRTERLLQEFDPLSSQIAAKRRGEPVDLTALGLRARVANALIEDLEGQAPLSAVNLVAHAHRELGWHDEAVRLLDTAIKRSEDARAKLVLLRQKARSEAALGLDSFKTTFSEADTVVESLPTAIRDREVGLTTILFAQQLLLRAECGEAGEKIAKVDRLIATIQPMSFAPKIERDRALRRAYRAEPRLCPELLTTLAPTFSTESNAG